MIIVITSDTHFPVDPRNIPKGDVFIHAGDLMNTGYPEDFARNLEWLRALPHQKKFFIPGNHDFHLQVYPGPALQELRAAGVTVVGLPGNTHYDTVELPNGMRMLGLPYVQNLPRWAFNSDSDETLFEYLTQFKNNDIIVSHSPMYGIRDEVKSGVHVGMRAYRRYFEHYLEPHERPKFWFCGHIHEGYGFTRFMGTNFHNVAMCNRLEMQVNAPVVIKV